MQDSLPGLSFVIPAYNETTSILQTVERLQAVLARLAMPSEIIVVDDGSSDGTGERLRGRPGVRVIRHPVNSGYGRALKTGIVCARYEWMGIVDADGTYDIELIPELVACMREGFHMAVAARKNVFDHDGPIKRVFRKAVIRFINLVLAARVEDPNSGLRIFSRDMALLFFPFLCNTFSFTTSITICALGEGYFVKYVPMNYSKRDGKSKVRHFRDSLRMAQLIMQGITFFNPLKLSVILIFCLLLFGALPAGVLAALGWTAVATYHLAVVVSSALLFAIGILCDTVRITSRFNDTTLLTEERRRLAAMEELFAADLAG